MVGLFTKILLNLTKLKNKYANEPKEINKFARLKNTT